MKVEERGQWSMQTISEIVKSFREADPRLIYLGEDEPVTPGKFLEFEHVKWNGKIRIVPTEALNLPGRPEGRPFMYRGQVIKYPTCTASLLRGLTLEECALKAQLTFERFRVAELELLMQKHPFMDVWRTRGFDVDWHGLAQHYGIPTALLDLTSNVEVAAFFASAIWDGDVQKFIPADSGTGVMYRFDWSAYGPGYSKYFEPVGFGPGLRPARQHAWTFKLNPGVDFQTVPHVEAVEFKHSKAASAELFEMFSNGDWLYPPDSLALIVERLRDLPFLTMNAIRHAARSDGQKAEDIEGVAERAAHFLSTRIGIDVLDGYQLELEDYDLKVALQQASDLDRAIGKMRVGLRIGGVHERK